jgi:hypothetical protein
MMGIGAKIYHMEKEFNIIQMGIDILALLKEG